MQAKKPTSGVLEVIRILKKYKKWIIINTVSATCIATVVAFLLPQWYLSFAVIRPNQNASASAFGAMLGAKGLLDIGKNLNVGGLQYSDLDYYKSLLLSRNIGERMVKEFDLQHRYETKFLFEALKVLEANTDIQPDLKSNLFVLGVYDTDPQIARKMTQSYLAYLDDYLRTASQRNLISNRDIIQKRLAQNVKDLKIAEDSLKHFEQKHGVVIPQEQFTATIKTISDLESKKLLLEMELQTSENTLGDSHGSVIEIKQKIAAINAKLESLEKDQRKSIDPSVFVSLKDAPELIVDFIRLTRNVEVQNSVYVALYPISEQMKMDAEKNPPSFDIVDQPFVPEYKEKPKRSKIILGGMLVALFSTTFFVFGYEYFKKSTEEVS